MQVLKQTNQNPQSKDVRGYMDEATLHIAMGI